MTQYVSLAVFRLNASSNWRAGRIFGVLSVLSTLSLPVISKAQLIGVSITIAPPELPVYEQPPIPEPGYIWSPGYWAYGPDGYFWVPGTWVLPPTVGLLWTPGYWGWRDGVYVWNTGYWGPHIGFYGGVNYGFGYGGVGYEGGYWRNGVFAYNRTVNNFGNVNITNVYNKTVIVNTSVTHVSFNGGSGGTTAQPTAQEEIAAHESHVAATPAQVQHQQTASTDKALLASENHGQPAIAATAKPADFKTGVVAAKHAGPTASPSAKPTGMPAASTTPSVKPRTGLAAPSQGLKSNPGPKLADQPPPNKPNPPPRVSQAPKPSVAAAPRVHPAAPPVRRPPPAREKKPG